MTLIAPRDNTQPVILAMSILASAQLLFAGAGLSEVIGAKAVFIGLLLIAAAQGGIQFWVKNQVTAVANVVAQLDAGGKVVAGPALIDVPDGEPVHVRPILGPPPVANSAGPSPLLP